MDFCTKCGAPLPEGATFCTRCGTPVTPAGPQNAYGGPGPQPGAGQQGAYGGPGPQPGAGQQAVYGQSGPQPGAGQQAVYGGPGPQPGAGPQTVYGGPGPQPGAGQQTAYGQSGPQPVGQGQAFYGQPAPRPPKKKGGALKIVIPLLIVAVLAAAAVILIPRLTGKDETTTQAAVTEPSSQQARPQTEPATTGAPQTAYALQTVEDRLPQIMKLIEDGGEAARALSKATKTLCDAYRADEGVGTSLGEYVTELEAEIVILEGIAADAEKLRAEILTGPAPKGEEAAVRDGTLALLSRIGEAAESMRELCGFYIRQMELYVEHYSFMEKYADDDFSDEYLSDFYTAVKELQEDYKKLEKPALVKEIWDLNTDKLSLLAKSLYYYYSGSHDVTLEIYNFAELSDHYYQLDYKYNTQTLDAMKTAFDMEADLFSATLAGDETALESGIVSGRYSPEVPSASRSFRAVYDMASEIYPNTYAGRDSVVNLAVSTVRESQDVLIETEVVGFTQPQEQKLTLTQRPQYLMIKPPVLIDLPDLSTRRTTTLRLKITDNDTGAVLVQESRQVTLYSLYDVFYSSDEFGVTEQFSLLGWLRPESEAVSVIKQTATRYLESLNKNWGILPGYQNGYGESEEITTKLQVAAIQKAISELGVRYQVDAYSYSAHQHVLTPDQVLAQKSGLCIETSLLMASCLQSMSLHPMIILTPGHCQVAVETWQGSRQYYLIETTKLPYAGITIQGGSVDWNGLFVNPTDPSDSFWQNYLYGEEGEEYYDGEDVFVIDCDLRTLMNLQGLESVQAKLDIKPVEFAGNGELPTEEVDPGDAEYVTLTNGNGTFAVMAKADALTVTYDNNVVICPLGEDGVPLITVGRYLSMDDPSEYLNAWYTANISGNSLIVEFDGEISSSEIYDETYYYIAYTETDEDDPAVTLYKTVLVKKLAEGGVAIFYMVEDLNETEADEDAAYEALGIAMLSYTAAQ